MHNHSTYFYRTMYTNDAHKNLLDFKRIEQLLVEILSNKSKSDSELNNYLTVVLENKKENTVNYIDRILRKSDLVQKKSSEISKFVELFTRRLELEIKGADRKSLEVSINILNSTYSSMNNKLGEIQKSYETSFQGNDVIIMSGNVELHLPHMDYKKEETIRAVNNQSTISITYRK